MSGPALASRRLQRALLASARRHGVCATVAESRWTPWNSVTFSGARHVVELAIASGDAADGWLTALPEEEFDIAGHLVADLAVSDGRSVAGPTTVSIEALTVET